MSIKIAKDVSLSAHTTLHVGGVADYFVEVFTVADLTKALRFAQQNAAPVFFLGGGSNVLFSDDGYRGLVIKNAISGYEYVEGDATVSVRVGAGVCWDEFVSTVCQKKYWGVENLSAIPGTVGATPIQNVGAYGVEVSQVIESVTAIDAQTLVEKNFSPAECRFSYRDSFFKTAEGKQWVVTAVTFVLHKKPQPNLAYADLQPLQSKENLSATQVRDFVKTVRSKKFPDWNVVGTAGSFFKNPIVSAADYTRLHTLYPAMPAYQTDSGDWKLSLGWLLDKVCGLKGYCDGEVCLYENQALVLTNTGDSATAISEFVKWVIANVQEKTRVHIEPEVLFVDAAKKH
jgi:UDP-N-acetylmuramate dehydrogenase